MFTLQRERHIIDPYLPGRVYPEPVISRKCTNINAEDLQKGSNSYSDTLR